MLEIVTLLLVVICSLHGHHVPGHIIQGGQESSSVDEDGRLYGGADADALLAGEEIKDSKQEPRIVKLDIFIDGNLWSDWMHTNEKNTIADDIDQLLKEASSSLRKLPDGGFELKKHGSIQKLEDSVFKIGKTYKDRRVAGEPNTTFNITTDDMIPYALVFQESVKEAEKQKKVEPEPGDVLRLLFSKRFHDDGVHAAAEENCLCHNSKEKFPCVAVISIDMDEYSTVKNGALLAHEVGHTLGAEEHDDDYGYIMSTEAESDGGWSEKAKKHISSQNNTCLKGSH